MLQISPHRARNDSDFIGKQSAVLTDPRRARAIGPLTITIAIAIAIAWVLCETIAGADDFVVMND